MGQFRLPTVRVAQAFFFSVLPAPLLFPSLTVLGITPPVPSVSWWHWREHSPGRFPTPLPAPSPLYAFTPTPSRAFPRWLSLLVPRFPRPSSPFGPPFTPSMSPRSPSGCSGSLGTPPSPATTWLTLWPGPEPLSLTPLLPLLSPTLPFLLSFASLFALLGVQRFAADSSIAQSPLCLLRSAPSPAVPVASCPVFAATATLFFLPLTSIA